MRHPLGLRPPGDAAISGAQREQRLARRVAIDENQLVIDQRRGGVLPGNDKTAIKRDQVFAPKLRAISGIQAIEHKELG